MQFSKKYNTLSRILLGILFLFSGLAKAVNPFGFSVKVGEYLNAMHLEVFSFLSPAISIMIIALEIALSLFLFCKILPRISSWIIIALTSVFTLLTLWDLLFDVIGDCGCFGDVIKVSPLVSFLKNIVILILAVINAKSIQEGNNNIIAPLIIFLVAVLLPLYVYNHLPLYDSSGYSIGTTIDNNLPMFREDFMDVSQDVLLSSDSMLIVVIQNPDIVPDLTKVNMRAIALSAYDLPNVNVEHFTSDYSLLKQVMPNSKGGALLVKDGAILNKWAMNDCPYLK